MVTVVLYSPVESSKVSIAYLALPINNIIMHYTPNSNITLPRCGPSYTRFFALWPQLLDSGSRVWLDYYYITPDHIGRGRILSHAEYAQETGLGEP